MISTSDGSLPKEEAKAFAKQYAKEFQAEKEAPINELVKGRAPNFERGEIGQDLKWVTEKIHYYLLRLLEEVDYEKEEEVELVSLMD